MGRRGTYEVVIGANGEPMRRELSKSETDLRRWEGSVGRMYAKIEGGEAKAVRAFAAIYAAARKLGAAGPLTERQLALVRAEIEKLERAGHKVPETLRKMFPAPTAAEEWRKEVDAVGASLQRITADEVAAERALQQLSQAVREAGGVSALTARQLAHVRQEIERLRAAGAKVVPLRLQPLMQGPAPVSRATTDHARWMQDLGKTRTELQNLGREETRALAVLGRLVDEMGGLGAGSRLSAEQLAHVTREVERLTAAGGRAPRSLRTLVPGTTTPGAPGLGATLRTELGSELQNVAQGYAGELGAVGSAVARAGPLALGLTAAVGGTVAVMAAGVNTLRQWSGELLDAAGRVQDLSVQTRLHTDTLQEWSHAGAVSGVGLEHITDATVKLSRGLATGGPAIQRALGELGLSFDELRGMAPEQQFERVAEAISRVPDPGRQAAYAMTLFRDKSGHLMKLLRDDFRGAADDAQRFGLVIGADLIGKADALGDSLVTLRGAWAGLKAEIAGVVVGSGAARDTLAGLTETVARVRLAVKGTPDTAEAGAGPAGPSWLGLIGGRLAGSVGGSLSPVLAPQALGNLWSTADAMLPDLLPPPPRDRVKDGGMPTLTAEQFFGRGQALAAGRAAAIDATARIGFEQSEEIEREMDALVALQDELAALGAAHRSTYGGMIAEIDRASAARRREALGASNSGAQLAAIERIRALQQAEARRGFIRTNLGEDAGDAARRMSDLARAVELARREGALTEQQFESLGAALDAASRRGEKIPPALQGFLGAWRATSGPWGETQAAAPDIQAQYDAFQATLQARLGAGTMTPGAWAAAAKEIDALAMRARAARVEISGLRGEADGVGARSDRERVDDELAKAREQLARDLARGPDDIDVQAAAWARYAETLSRVRGEARGAGVAVGGLGESARDAADRADALAMRQEAQRLTDDLAHLERIGASPAAFEGLLRQFEDLAERARAAGLYVGDLDAGITRLSLRRDVSALSALRAQPMLETRGLVDRALNLDAAFNPEAGGRAPQGRAEQLFYARALEEIYTEAREKGHDLEQTLPGLREQLNRTFREAGLATQDWQASLATVTDTLQILGIEGSSAIGRIVGAIPAGAASVTGLMKVLDAPGGFSGWGKTALGNKLALGASVGQLGGVASSLLGGMSTTGGRFFAGAGMGGQVGAMFGPIGAGVGAALGGAISAVFGAPWKGASRAAARFFGRQVSDELAQAIDATADRLGTNAHTASMLHISDAMQESGADPREFGRQIIDLFNAVELGVVPAREGITELGRSFSAVAEEAERAGVAGDATLRSLIGRARELRIDVPEIREFVGRQTDALIGSMGFIASSSTRQRELFDAQGNPRYRTDRRGNRVAVLDEEGQQRVDRHGNPLWERATETIVEQTGGIQIATEADARAQGTIFGVAWAAAVRQRGFVGAADALREAFSNLTNTAGELGFDISAVLGNIPMLMDLTKEANPFRGAATGSQQLGEALRAVADQDLPLTMGQFAAFEQQAQRAAEQARQAALDEGYDAAQAQAVAIEAVAPLLQRLVEVSRSYGFGLSEGTQGLLDMAKASEIAFQTDSADRLIEAINALTRALGGVPPAAERAGAALGGLERPRFAGDFDFGDMSSSGGYPHPGAGPAESGSVQIPRPRPSAFTPPPDSYSASAGFGPLRLTRDTVIHAHQGEYAMVIPRSAGPMNFMSASSGLYGPPIEEVGLTAYAAIPEIDYGALRGDRWLSPLRGVGAPALPAGDATGEGLAELVHSLAAAQPVTVQVASPTTHIQHGFMTAADHREYMRIFERDLARATSRGTGPMAEAIVAHLRRAGVRIGAR